MKLSKKKIILAIISFLLMFSWAIISAKSIKKETILAEFDGGEITKEYLDFRISKIPAMFQSRYKTVDGQQQLVDMLCTEEIFFLEATKLGYHNKPEVIEQINTNLRPIYIELYREEKIDNMLTITDEEKKTFYNENPKYFTQKAKSNILYIQAENDEAASAISKEFAEGKDFYDIMNKYSINQYARKNSGEIKNLYHNGYITGVGKDPVLDSLIINSKIDEMVGPITTKTGIHFFKLIKHIPEKLKPFDEVQEQLTTRIRPIKENLLYNNLINDLMKDFNVEIDNNILDSVNFIYEDVDDAILNKQIISSDIENLNYTGQQLKDKFNSISSQEKMEYKREGGISRWAQIFIEKELLYQGALKEDFSAKVNSSEEVDQVRRSKVLQAIYKDKVTNSVKVTDEEIDEYYQANKDKYRTNEFRKIQAFYFSTEKEADKFHKKITKARKKNNQKAINKIVDKYIESNKDDGILDHVYNNKIIPGIGKDEAYSQHVFQTAIEDYSPVFLNSKQQYTVIKVLGEQPIEIKPLSEVKDQIKTALMRINAKETFDNVKLELSETYNLKQYPERLEIKLSAEELFELADESQKKRKYKDAVMYYDQIIKQFKNNDDDYKAMFMKGFLYSEEMKDNEKALSTFSQLLEQYPNGDLHESAQFMIDSLKENKAIELKE